MRWATAMALLVACFPTPSSPQELDDTAVSVIVRSRATENSYSNFAWNWLTRPGEGPREEWSAEFHKQDLHRVETPRERLIADCASRTGTYFSIETGEIFSGPGVAGAACGVQSNSQILSATHDGTRDTPFGLADRITVRDPENLRSYEIVENGAIVGATIALPDGTLVLRMETVALLDVVPDDIFSEVSLKRSAVPEKYRQHPGE